MLKRTIKFLFYCLVVNFYSCSDGDNRLSILADQHFRDSISEARIDSAYAAISTNCDTLMLYQVPQMVDSFLKDSSLLVHFFNSNLVFRDADKKLEKVSNQLRSDCDSNLLKETYRRARLLQKLKPKLRKK